VDPDWMRQGIATRLIADVVERARGEKIEYVSVTANPLPQRRLHTGPRRRDSVRRRVAHEPGDRGPGLLRAAPLARLEVLS
jgi:GNAT superfamily N-acetyltransferase